MIEDQKFCLDQILKIIENEKVDIVLIAGDIFDTSIPNNEAMKVYSDFVDEDLINVIISFIFPHKNILIFC